VTDVLRTKVSNPFVLLYRVIFTWVHSLPILLGLAVIGAIFAAVSFFLITLVTGRFNAPLYLLEAVQTATVATPLVLAHAGFLVVASRITGSRLDQSIEKMSFAQWLGASLCVAALMAAILLPVLIWAPRAPVMVLVAVLMLTPLLPALTLGERPGKFSFWVKFFLYSSIAAVPWLVAIEILGLPSQIADSWGFLQGGIILIPLTALHTFLASSASAVVSTVIFISLRLRTDAIRP
jgi:hypothetical protein